MPPPTPHPMAPPDPDQPGTDPACAVPPPDPSEPATILNRPSAFREPLSTPPTVIPPAADSVFARPAEFTPAPSALTVREPTPIPDRAIGPVPKPPVSVSEDTPAKPKYDARTRVHAVLRVVRGENPGQPFPLLDGKNYIGRATPDKPMDLDMTAQERVEQVWVSRQHALVTLAGDTVIVEDLNSLNGTFVNRVRIHPGQPRVLVAGDVLQVGTVQMRLEV